MILFGLWEPPTYLIAFRVKERPDKNHQCRRSFSLSFSTTQDFLRLSWLVGSSLFLLTISHNVPKYLLIITLPIYLVSICSQIATLAGRRKIYLLGSMAEVHRAIYEICCKRWLLYFAGLNRKWGVAACVLVNKILEILEFELILGSSLFTINCMVHV